MVRCMSLVRRHPRISQSRRGPYSTKDATPRFFLKLSAVGSSLLATAAATLTAAQFSSDGSGNLYVGGSSGRTQPQPGVVDSFVDSVAAPSLPGGFPYGGNVAIIAKFAPDLTPI